MFAARVVSENIKKGLWFLAEWRDSCNISVWRYAVISVLLHGIALLLL
jgi:hypothetical protein